jgi:superfamily II DNA or RNA helicase
MIRLNISNRIYFDKTEIPKPTLKLIKDRFRHANPEFYKKKNMGYYTGSTPRQIVTFRLEDDKKTISVPTGGLEDLLDILYEAELDIDKLNISGQCLYTASYEFFDEDFEFRQYQLDAIQEIVNRSCTLVRGGTASGKTEIALGAIAESGLKAGIIVHNRELFEQWIGRIKKRLGIPNNEIGRVGGGKFKIGDKITVMMQQTAYNKLDLLKNEFAFIVLDECHRTSARTFLACIDSFNARIKLGLTAWEKRQDGKQFLIHDMFGPVHIEVKKEYLKEQGFTTPVILHIVKTNFYFDYMWTDMFEELSSYEDIEFDSMSEKEKANYCEYKDLPRNNYNDYLVEAFKDIDRNNKIFKYVRKEVKAGNRCLIFSKRREYCTVWKDVLEKRNIPTTVLWGGGGNVEKRRINEDLAKLRSGEIMVGVGTIADEGLDLPAIEVGFIPYRNAKNFGQLTQQEGRFARLFEGKKSGRIYYFWDHRISRYRDDPKLLKKVFSEIIYHV